MPLSKYWLILPENEDGIFDAVLQGHIDFSSDPWPSISNGAKDLVKKMLRQDPKERLTAAEILSKHLSSSSSMLSIRNHGFFYRLRDGKGAAMHLWFYLSNKLFMRSLHTNLHSCNVCISFLLI